jgi:hypothetical protein
MQLFRLIIVVLATLAVTGRYLQEVRRLSVIRRLPGKEARAYYERTRDRSERFLTIFTAGMAVLAIAAVVYSFVLKR